MAPPSPVLRGVVTIETSLAQRLRASRIAAKLTQQQLANRLGVHTQTISYYERGEWIPPTERLEQIADVLDDATLLEASDPPGSVRPGDNKSINSAASNGGVT